MKSELVYEKRGGGVAIYFEDSAAFIENRKNERKVFMFTCMQLFHVIPKCI